MDIPDTDSVGQRIRHCGIEHPDTCGEKRLDADPYKEIKIKTPWRLLEERCGVYCYIIFGNQIPVECGNECVERHWRPMVLDFDDPSHETDKLIGFKFLAYLVHGEGSVSLAEARAIGGQEQREVAISGCVVAESVK